MDLETRDVVTEDPSAMDDLTLRRLLRQLLVGMVVLVVALGVLAVTLQEPLEAGAEAFVATFGLMGVFGGVLITDTFALTHEPLLFAAHAGGLAFWPTFLTASLASVSAGGLGWALGSVFGRLGFIQRIFARYRIHAFLHRYGVWAIAVAALTPFPFSVATWASGAVGVSLKTVMLGSLFRVPKVLFYFGLIILGWTLGDLPPELP